MARQQKAKPDLGALFKKTEPGPAEDAPASGRPTMADIPAEGRTMPTGVGLKESELALIDEIAAELGVARNALIRYAVRYFLAEYRAGQVTLEVIPPQERKNRLKMP